MNNEEQQFLNKQLWDAADRLARLTKALGDQFKENARLEAEIRKSLTGLGYGI